MGNKHDDEAKSPFELPDSVAGLPSRLPEAQRADDDGNPAGGAGWISGEPEDESSSESSSAAADAGPEEPHIPTDLYIDEAPPSHDALADSSDLVVSTAAGSGAEAPDTPIVQSPPVSPLSLLAGLVTAMVIGLVVAIPLTIWATSPGTDDEAEAKPPPTEHRGVKIQRTMKAPQEKSKQEILDERLRELEEREALEAEAEAEAAQPGSGDDPGAPATETPAEGSAEDGPSLSEQLGD